MSMQTGVIISVIVVMLFIGTTSVFAQTTNQLRQATGILPDSPLYGLDKALDSLVLALQLDRTEKAKLGLEIAQERLEEIKEMVDREDFASAEDAEDSHDDVIREVENAVEEDESDGSDIDRLTQTQIVQKEDELEDELEGTVEVEKLLKLHRLKVIEVKETVKQKLEENLARLTANEKIDIDRVSKGLETAISRVEIKTEIEMNRIEEKLKVDFQRSDVEVQRLVMEKDAEVEQRVVAEVEDQGVGSLDFDQVESEIQTKLTSTFEERRSVLEQLETEIETERSVDIKIDNLRGLILVGR